MFGSKRCDVYSWEDERRVSGWERRLVVLKRSGAGAEKVRCCTAESTGTVREKQSRVRQSCCFLFFHHCVCCVVLCVQWKWSKEQRRVAEQGPQERDRRNGPVSRPGFHRAAGSGRRGERDREGDGGRTRTRTTGRGEREEDVAVLKVTGGKKVLERRRRQQKLG